MEKTFAREIFNRMKIGEAYRMSDLMTLVEMEDRLPYFPEIKNYNDLKNFDFKSEFYKAMNLIVSSGYVTTEIREFTTAFTKGRKYGSKIPTSNYHAKVWIRIK